MRRAASTDVVCNLHWFPETIEGRLGDGSDLGVKLTYSHEEKLLGTAGGVRNVRDFFGDEPFLVMAGDALTDIDFAALAAAHERNDGLATLAVKKVTDTQEYGVIVTGSDGRVQGFQEKPDPAEALSDLANCMIYALSPEIFDHFPDMDAPDFALDVFPALLDGDIPFYVHETDGYWNDVGSPPEYLQGNLDVARRVTSTSSGRANWSSRAPIRASRASTPWAPSRPGCPRTPRWTDASWSGAMSRLARACGSMAPA